jgi:hypothetical protein
MEITINYFAVLVCGVVHQVLGALWYSPLLFGRPWLKSMGKNEAEIKAQNPPSWIGYLVSFVAALIMAFVLAHVLEAFQATSVTAGLQGGFWVWLGFVIMGGLGSVLFEGRRFSLYALYNAYFLVSLLLMGTILTVWS